ncbi:MAG: haloacid dehalogenase-like hydrolase [Puniceicoccales bacterium]|jgi:hypothetical protein|nr:haloacid dehalogenase-like hydrolase [Puniceicoccales bacterium]
MNRGGGIIACIWDFDRTLIPGNMQAQLFHDYGIDETNFWTAVDAFSAQLRKRNIRLSDTLVYLNFILVAVRQGYFHGFSKQKLTCYGENLTFFPGVPEIFSILKMDIEGNELYRANKITLEHYIISSGHAEIIRGSRVAPFVDDVFACEFLGREIEDEIQKIFQKQKDSQGEQEERPSVESFYENDKQISLGDICDSFTFEGQSEESKEIKQIACVVDNTQKTRYLFEINKGCNKDLAIDINSVIGEKNRRIPFQNMIYIADGLSDVPAFSVIRSHGGKAFAVYNPDNEEEFARNDRLLEEGRIDAYGPADYRPGSSTTKWLRLRVQKIAQKIVNYRTLETSKTINDFPKH